MPEPSLPADAGAGPRRRAIFLALLAAGLIFSYARIIDAPFVHDDLYQIRDQPRLRRAVAGQDSVLALLVPALDRRRPLPDFTFALNYLIFGDGPHSFHLINLGLHFLNVILLLGLARSAARTLSGADPPWAPLAAGAMLWAFQPVHTQAVTYVVQRGTLLCAFFSLAALWLWIEAGDRERGRRPLLYLASGVAALLALLSKESAASLPLLVVLWEWLDPRSSRRRRVVLSVAVLILSLVGAALLLHFTAAEVSVYSRRYGLLSQRLLSQPLVIWHYLSLLVLPHPARMALEVAPSYATGLFSPLTTGLALAGLVALAGTGLALARRRSLIGFGVLFFFIALIPESGFWPIALSADHRLYLPSTVLMVELGAAAVTIRRFPSVLVIAVVLVLLCGLSAIRNRDWASEGALWRDTVAKAPDYYPNWQNLAGVHLRERRLGAALVAINRVRALTPHNYRVMLAQASIYLTVNRLEWYRALRPAGSAACGAARIDSTADATAALAMAECEAEEGRRQSALDYVARSARLDPNGTYLVWFSAWDLAAAGQKEAAWRLAAKAQPGRPEYERLLLLGLLALQAEDHDRAAAIYRQALELRPDGIEALLGLGQALEPRDPAGAVEYFRRAREADPQFPPATDALCRALTTTGNQQAPAVCGLAELQRIEDGI